MFGIEQFTAIINPPEAGILAVGAVEARPVVVDGAVVIRRRMRVTMSCDHRVIDGATGARFLQTLRRLIENPLYDGVSDYCVPILGADALIACRAPP